MKRHRGRLLTPQREPTWLKTPNAAAFPANSSITQSVSAEGFYFSLLFSDAQRRQSEAFAT
jgi:hypothetical protein